MKREKFLGRIFFIAGAGLPPPDGGAPLASGGTPLRNVCKNHDFAIIPYIAKYSKYFGSG